MVSRWSARSAGQKSWRLQWENTGKMEVSRKKMGKSSKKWRVIFLEIPRLFVNGGSFFCSGVQSWKKKWRLSSHIWLPEGSLWVHGKIFLVTNSSGLDRFLLDWRVFKWNSNRLSTHHLSKRHKTACGSCGFPGVKMLENINKSFTVRIDFVLSCFIYIEVKSTTNDQKP
jgi:hypothetical protein